MSKIFKRATFWAGIGVLIAAALVVVCQWFSPPPNASVMCDSEGHIIGVKMNSSSGYAVNHLIFPIVLIIGGLGALSDLIWRSRRKSTATPNSTDEAAKNENPPGARRPNRWLLTADS
jgi:hypothetical protein